MSEQFAAMWCLLAFGALLILIAARLVRWIDPDGSPTDIIGRHVEVKWVDNSSGRHYRLLTIEHGLVCLRNILDDEDGNFEDQVGSEVWMPVSAINEMWAYRR